MKLRRLLIFTVLLLSSSLTGSRVSAQSSLLDNLSVSLGVGLDYYKHQSTSLFANQGKDFQLTITKGLLRDMGLRAQLQRERFQFNNNPADYYFAHVDYVWSITNTFLGNNPNRKHNLDGFAGFSLAVCRYDRSGSDNDFASTFGLQYQYMLDYGFYLYLEEQNYVLPPAFDNCNKLSLIPTLNVGLAYRFVDNPYRFQRGESVSPSNDWYFSVSTGINSMQYRGVGALKERLQYIAPCIEFGLGKNLSSVWATRFQWSGLQVRNENEAVAFFNLHADIMVNAVNFFLQESRAPKFSVYPYVGPGLFVSQIDIDNIQIAFVGGLYSRYTVGHHSDLYIDIRYGVVPPRFAHVSQSQSFYTVGLATIGVGYVYNIGTSTCRDTRNATWW